MYYYSATVERRSRLRCLGFAVAALIVGTAGVAPRALAQGADDARAGQTQQGKPPIVIGDDAIDTNQAIKPDFTIGIAVTGEPEPSGNYKVDAQGNVNMRYAGAMTPVAVSGRTPTQAQDAIAAYLKTYIKSPIVKVTIVEIPRKTAFIGGAVRFNGPVVINSDTSLLDVISRAEYTEGSDLSQVMIIRKDQPAPIYVNFEKFLRTRNGEKVDESLNPLIKDKDRILISSRNLPGAVGAVSVFGEVIRPSAAVPLRTTAPMTVREAINLAGGAMPTADRHRVTIRRQGVDRPLVIDLDKAEQGDLVNNIELKADDTVYVERLETNAYINMNGGFVKPSKLVYDKRTMLTQAIDEVGGVAPYAKRKQGVIIRHPSSGQTQFISFNYDNILKGKDPDIELHPGDGVSVDQGAPPRQSPGVLDYLGAIGSFSYIFGTFTGRR